MDSFQNQTIVIISYLTVMGQRPKNEKSQIKSSGCKPDTNYREGLKGATNCPTTSYFINCIK